jgi:hypothetical protein
MWRGGLQSSELNLLTWNAITFIHLAVKKWSLARAMRVWGSGVSSPRQIVHQLIQSLYTPSSRGPSPRHIASMSVSVALYAITVRSIKNQGASSGVVIGFMFLSPHVIVPDKRHGQGWCHCSREAQSKYIQRSHFRLICVRDFLERCAMFLASPVKRSHLFKYTVDVQVLAKVAKNTAAKKTTLRFFTVFSLR